MAKQIKVTIVGDAAVGKTSLLISYTSGSFPEDYVPTVFDNFVQNSEFDDEQVALSLWDTAGQEDYDRIRPLSYPGTDVFLICFSIVDENSFKNVTAKWIAEVKGLVPSAEVILVGCKVDLRDDLNAARRLKMKGINAISFDKGNSLKEQIGAFAYCECSAKSMQGIKDVFLNAMASVAHKKQAAPANNVDDEEPVDDVSDKKQSSSQVHVEEEVVLKTIVTPANTQPAPANLGRLYNNKKFSDVQLELPSGLVIYANRHVLAANSTFFDSLFYNGQVAKQSVYQVNDAIEEDFVAMVKFIYTEELTVSDTNVFGLREIGKQYGVLTLLEKCEEFFAQTLTAENVFGFLDKAEKQHMKNLYTNCLSYVCKNARKIFADNHHFQLTRETISSLLKRDDLRIKELDLFKAVMRYCDHVHSSDKEASLSLAREFSPLIRYGCISMKELMGEVFPTNIMPLHDRMVILEKLVIEGPMGARQAALDYTFTIVQQVSYQKLIREGWKVAYQQNFGHSTTNDEIREIREKYAHNPEALVCCLGKKADSDEIELGAFGLVKDALAETQSKSAAEKHGEVYWYCVNGESFGFAEAANISLGSADTVGGPKRMSWHLSGGGGYRLGDNTDLNSSDTYEKIILVLE